MIPSRRSFLIGAGALLAAPSIVRVASLMALPAFAVVPLYHFRFTATGFEGGMPWLQTMSTVARSYEEAKKEWRLCDAAARAVPSMNETAWGGPAILDQHWRQSPEPVKYVTERRDMSRGA